MQFANIRKTVAAAVGTGLTWAYTALADGHVTALEWVGLAGAFAGVFGVYQAVNKAKPKATVRRRR